MAIFKAIKHIYSGGISKVYKSVYNGKEIICKEYFEKCRPEFEREKLILKKLKHELIINPVFIGKNKVIGFDFNGKDLKYFIDKNLNLNKLVNIVPIQIMQALKYLHKHRVVHFDLKPSNILLNGDLVKLIDFGSAKFINEPITEYNFTNSYSSLEYLLGYKNANFFKDIWSFGCIYYELLVKTPLFKENSSIGVILEILKTFGSPRDLNEQIFPYVKTINIEGFKPIKHPKFLDQLDQKSIKLFQRVFELNPLNRITAKDALMLM